MSVANWTASGTSTGAFVDASSARWSAASGTATVAFVGASEVVGNLSAAAVAVAEFTMGAATPPTVLEVNPRGRTVLVLVGQSVTIAEIDVPTPAFQETAFPLLAFQSRDAIGEASVDFRGSPVVLVDWTAAGTATATFDGASILQTNAVATATFVGVEALVTAWTVAGVTTPALASTRTLTAAQTLGGVTQSATLDVIADGYIAAQVLDGITQAASLDNKLYTLTDRISLKLVPDDPEDITYRIQAAAVPAAVTPDYRIQAKAVPVSSTTRYRIQSA